MKMPTMTALAIISTAAAVISGYQMQRNGTAMEVAAFSFFSSMSAATAVLSGVLLLDGEDSDRERPFGQ